MKVFYTTIAGFLMFGMVQNGFAQSAAEPSPESTGMETAQEQQESTSQTPQEQKETMPTNAEETYKDIEKTIGFVPQFLKEYPKEGITGAWIQMKQLEMGKTSVDDKNKQLISLAVAAQVPCDYCVHFHSSLAKAYGASEAEIKESVALAGGVRQWSTFLNGANIDRNQFDSDVEKLVKNIKEQQKLAE